MFQEVQIPIEKRGQNQRFEETWNAYNIKFNPLEAVDAVGIRISALFESEFWTLMLISNDTTS